MKLRLFALICMAAVLLGTLGTLSALRTPGVLNAAETGAAKTEFETSSESTFLASVTLKNGDDVEIQFHTLDEAVSFSIATESPDDGCEFAVELYEWNENIKKTLRGEKLHSWTVSDWADAGEITVDFTKLSGGALARL